MSININIGTEKCCFFINISNFLINNLRKKPFLYYSIEEAVLCAQNGHYSAGILIFSQLLNLFKEKTPQERHLVAHEILIKRPTQKMYEEIINKVKKTAASYYQKESNEEKDNKTYIQQIQTNWKTLIKELNEK